MARGMDDSSTSELLGGQEEVSTELFCGDFHKEFDDDGCEDDRKDRDDK